ncbi:MAG: RidA family protein [Candidatus Acidiferrum sp.]|jgi:2-iminobutanoate/2-iminopropanoate deaminase
MLSNLFTRRAFAGRFASLVSGLGLAAAAAPAAEPKKEATGGVKKMDFDGKPAGTGFITPLITFNDVIYIAGIGAHSHDQSEFPMDIDTHTKKVMEQVKHVIEVAGGTMDSILQLTVFLTKIEDYDGMNKVFKTYFPNSGPARTTVAVAALPGNSLVEINCTAAIVKK